MGVTLTDVLLFGKAQSDDVDNATLVIYRRNILRWSTLGGYLDVIVKGVSPLNLPDAIANSLSYVKAFGGTEQRNLPDGYTELEYIEGTGTQYINTGISAPDGFVVDTNVEFTDMTKADTIIGEEDNSSGAYVRRNFIKVQDNRWLLGMYSHTWGQAAAVNTKYHVVGSTIKNNGYIDANGSRMASMTTTGELSDNPLLLFTTSWELLSNDNCAHMKMYDVKIWDANNTLVRDMFPVRRSSDNAVGMYDTVSGQFFTNAGTGTFVAGGAAVPTPDAPMNIVSNNGVLRIQGSATGTVTQTGNPTPTTPVEPEFYQNHGLLLRAIGTDADAYDASTQTITRNIGYKIFNGTESFGTSTAYGQALFILSATSAWGADRRKDVLCQYFLGAPAATTGDMPEFTCFFNASGHFYFRTSETVDNFKAWLAELYANGTPLIVWFGKSTPETESFTPSVYADGTVETINVYGKNLCNKNDTESIGGWYNASYKIAVSGTNQTIVMRAQPGATYYYKHCSVTGGGRAFYTEVEDWDVGSDCSVMSGAPLIDKDTVRSITVSENAKWVFFNYGRVGQTATFEEQLADFMVSLTPLTSDTQYVPYYDGGTATAEMLLSIDEYTDEQEVISGNITRKVGVLVLDGVTEGRKLTPTWNTTYKRGNLTVPTIKQTSYLIADCACTHFPYSTNVQGAPTSPGFCSRSQDKLVLFTFAGMSNINSSSDANAWIASQYNAGTPVIVIYPLAEPTTESVAGQTLQVTGGDNTVSITQASLTGLELEAEYQAAVSLTIQEVQDANLDPNVEVTIN